MPTKEAINRAAAAASGWKHEPVPPDGEFDYLEWRNPQGGYRYEPPDFCSDRNALPSLLEAVRDAGKRVSYGVLLRATAGLLCSPSSWEIQMVEPRIVVEAALKALGRWPEEGETGE